MSEASEMAYNAAEHDRRVQRDRENSNVPKCSKCGEPESHINHEEWHHNGQPISHYFIADKTLR